MAAALIFATAVFCARRKVVRKRRGMCFLFCGNGNVFFQSSINCSTHYNVFLFQRRSNLVLLWLLLTSPSLIFHTRPLRGPLITSTNPINLDKEALVQFIRYDSVQDPTLVAEENEAFFIRAWKPLLSRHVLKTLRGNPKKTISVSGGRWAWAVTF